MPCPLDGERVHVSGVRRAGVGRPLGEDGRGHGGSQRGVPVGGFGGGEAQYEAVAAVLAAYHELEPGDLVRRVGAAHDVVHVLGVEEMGPTCTPSSARPRMRKTPASRSTHSARSPAG